jgi:hypothetical protein
MPVFSDNKCFIDGGIKHNYPLNQCLNDHNCKDEILGIKYLKDNNDFLVNIQKESSILDFLFGFTTNVIHHIRKSIELENINNEVIIYTDKNPFSLDSFTECYSNSELRKNLIEIGEQTALDFLKEKL